MQAAQNNPAISVEYKEERARGSLNRAEITITNYGGPLYDLTPTLIPVMVIGVQTLTPNGGITDTTADYRVPISVTEITSDKVDITNTLVATQSQQIDVRNY
jgi:hypothetical protein